MEFSRQTIPPDAIDKFTLRQERVVPAILGLCGKRILRSPDIKTMESVTIPPGRDTFVRVSIPADLYPFNLLGLTGVGWREAFRYSWETMRSRFAQSGTFAKNAGPVIADTLEPINGEQLEGFRAYAWLENLALRPSIIEAGTGLFRLCLDGGQHLVGDALMDRLNPRFAGSTGLDIDGKYGTDYIEHTSCGPNGERVRNAVMIRMRGDMRYIPKYATAGTSREIRVPAQTTPSSNHGRGFIGELTIPAPWTSDRIHYLDDTPPVSFEGIDGKIQLHVAVGEDPKRMRLDRDTVHPPSWLIDAGSRCGDHVVGEFFGPTTRRDKPRWIRVQLFEAT